MLTQRVWSGGLLVAVAISAVLALCAQPSHASETTTGDGSVSADNDHVTGSLSSRTVEEPAGTDGSADSTASSGAVSPCQWIVYPGDLSPPEGQKGGRWYVKFCDNPYFDSYEDYRAEVNSWDALSLTRANILQNSGVDLMYSIGPTSRLQRSGWTRSWRRWRSRRAS